MELTDARSRRLLALVVLVVPHFVETLRVVSDTHTTAENIRSPVCSVAVGAQVIRNTSRTTVAAIALPFDGVCSHDRMDEIFGRVVLLTGCTSFGCASLSEQRRVLSCVEQFGGLGVVQLQPDVSVVGFNFITDTCQPKPQSMVPFLCVGDGMEDALDALQQGHNVTVEMTVDDSLWDELWSSGVFLALCRGVIPALNIVGCGVATRGLLAFATRSRDGARPGSLAIRKRWSVGVPVFGCLLELSACGLRVVYCSIDPLFSDARISTEQNMALLLVPSVLMVVSCFISVTMCLMWGVFGSTFTKKGATIAILCAIALVVQSSLAAEISRKLMQVPAAPATASFMAVQITVYAGSGSLVLVWIQKFIVAQKKILLAPGEAAANKSLLKCIRWIQACAALRICHVVVLCLCWFAHTPWFFFWVLVLHLSLDTVCSVVQAFALTPQGWSASARLSPSNRHMPLAFWRGFST